MAGDTSFQGLRDQLKLRSQANAFFESAVLFALVDLGICQELSRKSQTARELGASLQLDESRVRRLLRAAAGFRLLSRGPDGSYQVAEEYRPFLSSDQSENSVIPWVRFIRSISPRLLRLPEAVAVQGVEEVEADKFCLHGADLETFGRAMHVYAMTLGSELPDFLDLSNSRKLLDLACGTGAYAFLLAQANPQLELCLMDEVRVLEAARRYAGDFRLRDRVQYHPGDALVDPIPGGHDVILISNFLHLIGPNPARTLIQRCYASLEAGGSLVVQAQYLESDDQERGWPVLLDLILLTSSLRGRNHSVPETMKWFRETGFRDVEFEPMSLVNVNSFVRGYK